MCGWVRDKFGVSWQIVPIALMNLLDNPAKASKVIHAMLPMKKLDINKLQDAYDSA